MLFTRASTIESEKFYNEDVFKRTVLTAICAGLVLFWKGNIIPARSGSETFNCAV